MSNAAGGQYSPDYAVPPGETLLETLKTLGMTQAELAARMGRPRKTVNEIIRGKASLTPETALQLERVLGVPAHFWNNYERLYREGLARIQEDVDLAKELGWLEDIPVRAMAKLGWIKPFKDRTQQLREVLGFFGVASPGEWRRIWLVEQQIALRTSPAFHSDPGAVSAWLRKGEVEAQRIHCAPYDSEKFKRALQQIRGLTIEPQEVFEPQVIRVCADCGVAAVFLPELPRTRVSGATRWLTPEKALIQLSFRYKRDDQLWFTFFHEASHLLLHGKRDVFLEEEGERDQREREADVFSANLLIPAGKMRQFVQSHPRNRYSKADISEFAEGIGVAPGIVVGRLQREQHLPYSHCNDLKRPLDWGCRDQDCPN